MTEEEYPSIETFIKQMSLAAKDKPANYATVSLTTDDNEDPFRLFGALRVDGPPPKGEEANYLWKFRSPKDKRVWRCVVRSPNKKDKRRGVIFGLVQPQASALAPSSKKLKHAEEGEEEEKPADEDKSSDGLLDPNSSEKVRC